MSILSQHRRLRTLLAWVATACAAAAAMLGATAPSASAYEPCPDSVTFADIDFWETKWPTPGANAKGVTLCHGFGGVPPSSRAVLQIVDLNDGAKVRLFSKPDSIWDSFDPNIEFTKRTTDEWYSYLRSLTEEDEDYYTYHGPGPERLFSTTNASFFKDSDNDHLTTKLPFPQWSNGGGTTCGVAGSDPSDPDHSAPKRYLSFGSHSDYDPPVQPVHIGPFPTYYDCFDAWFYIASSEANPLPYDATVGFEPELAIGGRSRRNYVGVYDNKFYIFTSDAPYTNAMTEDIMQAIQPGMYTMQLDGGGSAQMHSAYLSMDSSIPIFDRKIPDFFAVYRAR